MQQNWRYTDHMTDSSFNKKKINYQVWFPKETCMTQGDEYFIACLNGKQRAIRLHDYKGIYSYPWLYECVLYNLLGCKTPEELCKLIKSTFLENNINANKIKMLEIGAGSGIFAEQLKLQLNFKEIHGLDIINEAKLAAQRDRADLYEKYYIEDLTDLSKAKEYELLSQKYNCIGVACNWMGKPRSR